MDGEEPRYFGVVEHAVDGQRRLAIPKEWRMGPQANSPNYYFLPFLPGILTVLSQRLFDKRVVAVLESHANPISEDALAMAHLASRASMSGCDKQGRLVLAASVLEHMQLEIGDKATLVGAFSSFLIMSPERWEEVRQDPEATRAPFAELLRMADSGPALQAAG